MCDTCVNKNTNLSNCNCTYEPCSRKGSCCECVSYHRSAGEMPACFFDAGTEKIYDRSIDNFINTYNKKRSK